MLVQQVAVLCNVPVIEIGDAEIQDDLEKKGKIEYYEIEPVIGFANYVLNIPVNPEDKYRFDQQIQEKYQT